MERMEKGVDNKALYIEQEEAYYVDLKQNASISQGINITAVKSSTENKHDEKRTQYNQMKDKATSITAITTITATNYRKWVILVAAFSTNFLTSGFAFSMSILYLEWLLEFGRSNWETSLIQSVCTGMLFIAGIPSGLVITKYGPMKCGILGGMITALGLSLSYFATSILYLILLSGFLPGIGFSVCQISSSTIVMHHFDGRSRLLALSFIEVGTGVGSVVFPILLETLTTEYGWDGTLLVIGGTMLNLVVLSSSYKMPQYTSKNDKTSLDEKNNPTASNINNSKNGKDVVSSLAKHETTTNGLSRLLRKLFLNKTYMLFTLSMALGLAIFNSSLIFLIDCFESNGITRKDSVLILMYANIGSTICRFCPGILKQIPHISVLFIAALSSLLGSISSAAFPLVGSSYGLTLIAACCFRIAHSCIVTLRTISPVKLIRKEHYAAGIGTTNAVIGMVLIVAGPLLGYIRDVTGDYDTSFFCISAILFLSSVLFVITMVYRHYRKPDKHHQVISEE